MRIVPTTLSGEIANRLRNDIVDGGLPFGARLTLAELEARYSSGQMPIREALRQLQGEGLVELNPNRGARVREVDVEFVRNLFDVRVAIESMLTRRAAERIRPHEIAQLEEATRAFESALLSELPAVLEANRTFHAIINNAAGNGEANEILQRNRQLLTALWRRYGYSVGQRDAAATEHHQIVAALRVGDADAAACFAMAHAARAKLELIRHMSGS